jgi:hypothetical protein
LKSATFVNHKFSLVFQQYLKTGFFIDCLAKQTETFFQNHLIFLSS